MVQAETLVALHEMCVVLPDWTIEGTAAMSPSGFGGKRQAPFEQP
jgi:hypothetical protein